MSSGFGQRMATYVVVSSMVGVGVLTTSGYTVVAIGSNQIMLWLWLIGGVIAFVRRFDHSRVVRRTPRIGWRVYLLIRGGERRWGGGGRGRGIAERDGFDAVAPVAELAAGNYSALGWRHRCRWRSA